MSIFFLQKYSFKNLYATTILLLLSSLFLSGCIYLPDNRLSMYNKKMCTKGYGYYCCNLGKMQEEGKEIKKDLKMAIFNYKRGCSLGFKKGCKQYKKLLRREFEKINVKSKTKVLKKKPSEKKRRKLPKQKMEEIIKFKEPKTCVQSNIKRLKIRSDITPKYYSTLPLTIRAGLPDLNTFRKKGRKKSKKIKTRNSNRLRIVLPYSTPAVKDSLKCFGMPFKETHKGYAVSFSDKREKERFCMNLLGNKQCRSISLALLD